MAQQTWNGYKWSSPGCVEREPDMPATAPQEPSRVDATAPPMSAVQDVEDNEESGPIDVSPGGASPMSGAMPMSGCVADPYDGDCDVDTGPNEDREDMAPRKDMEPGSY